MWPVFPATQTLGVALAAFLLVLFATRILQPAWWRSGPARAAILVAFGAIPIGVGIWHIGEGLQSARIILLGTAIAYIALFSLLPAAVVTPIAAVANRGLLFAFARPREPKKPRGARSHGAAPHNETCERVGRRAVIHFGSAALPAMAAIGGASGFASAKKDPTMPVMRLRYPGLHPALAGLKILHLSDLHLGGCVSLEDLKRGLEIARAAHRPDLIVLTGDLADDVNLIPGALELLHEAGARYGAIAALGNHEYLHDIDVTRPLFEASPVPLLVGSGTTLAINGAKLFIAGADDPVHMHGDIAEMLEPTIDAATAHTPKDADFTLLLCHRPEGHGPAAARNYDLTLSGHTHGGQIGLLGRSILEKIKPGIGWWGAYTKRRRDGKGPSRLYTTSGFGHWFPFRIGCPTEMPLIVLEGGDVPAAGLPTRA